MQRHTRTDIQEFHYNLKLEGICIWKRLIWYKIIQTKQNKAKICLLQYYQTINLFQWCCWVCLLFSIYCWAWGLHLRVVCFPSGTPMKKTNVSSVSAYQLKIVSGLWIGMCLWFFNLQDPIWFWHMQTLSATTQLDQIQSWYRKFHSVTRNVHLGSCICLTII